jgi:hypothetical protein
MNKNNYNREDELNQSFYEYNGDDNDNSQNEDDALSNERIVINYIRYFIKKGNQYWTYFYPETRNSHW